MSASLPAEELPRRMARAVSEELAARREMDAQDTLAEMRRIREDQECPLPGAEPLLPGHSVPSDTKPKPEHKQNHA